MDRARADSMSRREHHHRGSHHHIHEREVRRRHSPRDSTKDQNQVIDKRCSEIRERLEGSSIPESEKVNLRKDLDHYCKMEYELIKSRAAEHEEFKKVHASTTPETREKIMNDYREKKMVVREKEREKIRIANERRRGVEEKIRESRRPPDEL